jgi:uncharacterized protein YjbI with pentapeptide repeats
MANKEHLEILREGYLSWHKWRKSNPYISPNLRGTDFRGSSFRNYNFSHTDFQSSCLSGVDVSKSKLPGCGFRTTDLRGSNLTDSYMQDAKFIRADLSDADLRGCCLHRAVFRDTKLDGSIFTGAQLYQTIFVRCNLSSCIGLDAVRHEGPSVLDIKTIRISKNLPINFLRGCGLPDVLIEYLPSIFNPAIDFYSCFISYSTKDEDFAQRLYADLQNNGVRCWFAPEDLKVGAELRPTFDEAIRIRDKLLVVLSVNSLQRPWVKREVEQALDEEIRCGQTKLFPVRLDDAIFDVTMGWATDVQRRHIGDFRQWKEHEAYQKSLARLLRDLKVEQSASPPQ